MVTAHGKTDSNGNTNTLESLGLKGRYDRGSAIEVEPWRNKTSIYKRPEGAWRMSEVRDNPRGIHRLDAFGTIAMLAIREGIREDEWVILADNPKSRCYDLITKKVTYRKIKNLIYKKKTEVKVKK